MMSTDTSSTPLLAKPRPGLRLEDCYFYHTMEVPGHGVVQGDWDLRSGVAQYLGGFDFAGKRALEIGPASGFLTFEMERRGARVLAVEVQDDPGWDFVPYPPSVLEPLFGPRQEVMHKLKNSWWFNHAAFNSKAQLAYADAYKLPPSLGTFDVAVMGSLLLHTRAPLQIVEQCANRAKSLIITDLYYPELEGSPICRLVPNAKNNRWDTWWEFSTDFFVHFLGAMGFRSIEVARHTQPLRESALELFTIVATRD